MKKTLLISALAAALCITLCACNNGGDSKESENSGSSVQNEVTKTPAEKTEELLNTLNFPQMVEIKGETLEATLGNAITVSELSDYSVFRCGSGANPDEFGILVANDAETAAKIKQALDSWVEYQSGLYRDYTPAEAYKLDDCFVELRGNTVTYAICEDNSKARQILI